MAPKLKLTAEPTFKAKVGIPVPGAKPVDVEFTFRHRTKAEAKAWWEGLAEGAEDAATVMDCITAWDLEDAFDSENVGRLLDSYPGAAGVILSGYLRELTGARTKN
jgi:hypothetical protein